MPLTELLQWEPEDIATAHDWLDDEADAKRDAMKGRG